MTPERLIRYAFPAALAAAVLGIPADLYHFAIESRVPVADEPLFKAHGALLMIAFGLLLIALAGIALQHGERTGRLGRVGTVMAFAGTALVLANIAIEALAFPMAPEALRDPQGYQLFVIVLSFALLSLGWLAIGVASVRAGLGSRGAAVLLCVGAVVAFTPLAGAYILLLAGVASTARSLRLPRGAAGRSEARAAPEPA